MKNTKNDYKYPYGISKSKDYKYFRVENKDDYGWFINCTGAVVVVPITYVKTTNYQKEIQFGLVKIFRHPIDRIVWEFCGGGIKDGENADKAATRELFEEMNISAYNIEKIGLFYAAPGRMYFPHHVYIAKDITYQAHNNRAFQEEEHIYDISFFNFDELNRMMHSNKIVSSPTISAISLIHLWWNRKKRKTIIERNQNVETL